MTKISPVNNHILIEPIKQNGFVVSERDIYQEIGIVIARASDLLVVSGSGVPRWKVSMGDKVYFDSWLAAKYPKEGGAADEFYWLVNWQDVRAIEYAEQPISK